MNWNEVLENKDIKVRRPNWPEDFYLKFNPDSNCHEVHVGEDPGNFNCWPIRIDVDDWEFVED